MAAQETSADITNISELDSTYIERLYPQANFNFSKIMEEMELEYRQIRKQQRRGFNPKMRSEAKRLKTFLSLSDDCKSSWAPSEMAAAGFYYTSVKTAIQCFCCGLVLLARSLERPPFVEHKKLWSSCKFILGKEVGNICKYDIRVQNLENNSLEVKNKHKEMESRFESFTNWPSYCKEIQPALLVNAGFFYTGIKDTVQCFACSGCLGNWEEGDDPWKEHAKWFPEHFFLNPVMFLISKEDLEPCLNIYKDEEIRLESFKTWPQDAHADPAILAKVGFFYTGKNDTVQCFYCNGCKCLISAFTDIVLDEHEWLQRKLSEAYNDFSFRKMFSFGDHTHFAVDLKLLYGDLAIVSKDISNQPQQQLTLPEILESFYSITVIEGEAGSGKTALLRKIAILWASGCCPILSRFKLVFYLSLNPGERDQSLADLICNQVLGLKGTLTEDSLKNICQSLTNEVLFLLDEFDKMNGLPWAIEDLIQKNYLDKHCLVIAVRPHQVRGIRQHANTLLSILEFPLSSTLYLLRKLFSYNVRLLGDFFIQLSYEETMRSMLKTPLFVAALASYWAQNPNGNIFTGTVILKAYRLYSLLKYPQEVDRMKAMMSACGELALQGLFKSLFDFSEKDLSEIGINVEEALYFGLLSKFTAQRLQPLYKFFHLSFQEFLAGQKMSELLASDVQEDKKKGLEYLQQINTFVKINGRYQYILRYACSEPSKAVPIIISHLLNLLSCKKSHESCSDIYMQQTPELNLKGYDLISVASNLIPEYYHSKFTETVLTIATELAYQSNMISDCAPMILEILTGKKVPLYLLKSGSIHQLCLDYPESLFLPSRFEEILTGREEPIDMAAVESAFLNLKVPSVEPIYTQAFQLFSNITQQVKEDLDAINNFRSYKCREIPDSIITPFLCVKSHEKIPYLKFAVKHMTSLEAPDIENLKLLFSFFDNIELNLKNCKGLLENIKMAIEENLKSFKVFSLDNTELNELEENLLLSMSSLESLDINWSELIQNCPNLSRLHLQNSPFFNMGALMNAMSSCKKLTEILLNELNVGDEDLYALSKKNLMENFSLALRSLMNLEELVLPNGKGIRHTATLIVQQCFYFPNLRKLQFSQYLSAEGLLEIAKVAVAGGFQKLESLCLSANHTITEETWRNFFQTLSNMPDLQNMDFSRLATHQIKCQATTVKSFVQCVSQLPSLRTINMIGWLFDEKDLNMFEIMKKQHPQSKDLSLTWKWILPFAPIINE
uniref:NLR family apoptosis inhibitory protein n=1 Tax=Naja naja TaxID=35670 RepID=A0A8C6X2L7_NAJNA